MPDVVQADQPHDLPPLSSPPDAGRVGLSELASEYALFNHGCLLTHGGLTCDPVADFVATVLGGDSTRVLAVGLDRKVFSGIGTTPETEFWDRTVCMVRHDLRDELFRFLLGTCGVDPVTRNFFRTTCGLCQVVDWLEVANHEFPTNFVPYANVTCFVVDGVRYGQALVHRHPTSPYDMVRVVRTPPSQATLRLAEAVSDPAVDLKATFVGRV